MKKLILILLLSAVAQWSIAKQIKLPDDPIKLKIINNVRENTLQRANLFLNEKPVTVTASSSPRSAGDKHDFFSEGDYWWPDPAKPNGPYIQKDGQSNPDNFSSHRLALMRMSDITSTLTSAWLLTGEKKYSRKAIEHLQAWFVNADTRMNPNMLYAQAIWGRFTGRATGLIDAYHLVEVAQSVRLLSDKGALSAKESRQIKEWFSSFLTWMTTHEYGIDEMNAKNNHGTCWVVTAASFAVLCNNKEVIALCENRFKTILLQQMDQTGGFPLEIKRTKPYGYSLFNMDAICNVAGILSTPQSNLFEYATADGKSLRLAMKFIKPYIVSKESWPYARDIYIWEEWPQRHSALLFAGLAWRDESLTDLYLSLPANPVHPEVIRNMPVRHPILWLIN